MLLGVPQNILSQECTDRVFLSSKPRQTNRRQAKRCKDPDRQDTGISSATADLRAIDRKGWRRASYMAGISGEQRLCQYASKEVKTSNTTKDLKARPT